MQRAFALLVAAVLAIGVAPAVTADEGHCNDIFMLSGIDPGGDARQGTNPGAVSCTVNDPDVHPDTNYTLPGATHVWVAVIADGKAQPQFGTFQVGDGEAVPLEFTLNALRGRYESQSIDLIGVAPTTPLTARVDIVPTGWPGDVPEEFFQTNTYIRI